MSNVNLKNCKITCQSSECNKTVFVTRFIGEYERFRCFECLGFTCIQFPVSEDQFSQSNEKQIFEKPVRNPAPEKKPIVVNPVRNDPERKPIVMKPNTQPNTKPVIQKPNTLKSSTIIPNIQKPIVQKPIIQEPVTQKQNIQKPVANNKQVIKIKTFSPQNDEYHFVEFLDELNRIFSTHYPDGNIDVYNVSTLYAVHVWCIFDHLNYNKFTIDLKDREQIRKLSPYEECHFLDLFESGKFKFLEQQNRNSISYQKSITAKSITLKSISEKPRITQIPGIFVSKYYS